MRMRPATVLFATAMLALMAVAGCSGSSTAGGDEIPEQNGLEVGTAAPDFRMKNQEQATVALSDYKGTKNVVLVFYPADFTPV